MTTRFDFSALERLKVHLASIRRNHVPTMAHYVSEPQTGFWHQPEKRYKSSLSSTATCVSSLVKANLWQDDKFPLRMRASNVAAVLIKKRTSALLPKDNPFSLSFVAEGVLDLMDAEPNYAGARKHKKHIDGIITPKLIAHLKQGKDDPLKGKLGQQGSSSVGPYPPSAYLTQLVLRVLKRCIPTIDDVREPVHGWARSEINKQIALITAKSRVQDPLQLAYAIILAVTTVPDERTSPEDKEIFGHALGIFFRAQNEDGSWPLSRPLFHYPEVGNAYCFDYELLVQLLSCDQLWDELLNYIPNLQRAVSLLNKSAFDLDPSRPGVVIGWASGHHPQLEGPESWSTACVYHFAYALDRLVAEGIRRALFEELKGTYSPPARRQFNGSEASFAPDFLDADLIHQGKTLSLKSTLFNQFVAPIDSETINVAKGGKLDRDTPMSAILFGPPGTSKTELADIISKYLGWPLVMVDPSYLVSRGMDRIQAMANKLFSMLAVAEQIVVLLDEFDEMGRERAQTQELLSRFITTAMLPKLAQINKERKIVFLLATNYITGFDAAFRRGGRFDMLLQVMPPNLTSKLLKWPKLKESIEKLPSDRQQAARDKIADLTYEETRALLRRLEVTKTARPIASAIQNASASCTLLKRSMHDRTVGEGSGETGAATSELPNWKQICETERLQIRIPGM